MNDDEMLVRASLEIAQQAIFDLKRELHVTEQDRDSWAQACADLENQRNDLAAKLKDAAINMALLKLSYDSLRTRNKELESLAEAYFDRLGN